jgi:hypothetical protein
MFPLHLKNLDLTLTLAVLEVVLVEVSVVVSVILEMMLIDQLDVVAEDVVAEDVVAEDVVLAVNLIEEVEMTKVQSKQLTREMDQDLTIGEILLMMKLLPVKNKVWVHLQKKQKMLQ